MRLPSMEHPSFTSPPAPPPFSPSPRSPRGQLDPTFMKWFGHLLATRPLAFWSGIWVSVFLIGVVAVGSLLSPSAAERRSVSAIALGSDSGVATQPLENRGKVPLWMFGAIAVTCTAGSILVSRQLNPTAQSAPPPRRRAVKKPLPAPSRQPLTRAPRSPQPLSSRAPGRRRPAKSRPQPPKRLPPYSPLEPLFGGGVESPVMATAPAIAPVPRSAQPQLNPQPKRVSFVVSARAKSQSHADQPSRQSGPHPQVQKRRPALQPPPASASMQPVAVTVVPPDHVHPLDWDQPRLADAVDLRQQKPIQSWL
ncbi:MAG: hypothetical protein NW220_00520 [Leptolyngbyaceae cyanobacterium bins.349]|nr:hypothetical protein [Leptolyngbyaceae cyanobacterium bins.349]